MTKKLRKANRKNTQVFQKIKSSEYPRQLFVFNLISAFRIQVSKCKFHNVCSLYKDYRGKKLTQQNVFTKF